MSLDRRRVEETPTGYVHFERTADAERALEEVDGRTLEDGRKIRIDFTRDSRTSGKFFSARSVHLP